MSEYQITCVVKDQGVITHVGIVGVTYPVMEVVNWILSKQHTFFTNKNGYKLEYMQNKVNMEDGF